MFVSCLNDTTQALCLFVSKTTHKDDYVSGVCACEKKGLYGDLQKQICKRSGSVIKPSSVSSEAVLYTEGKTSCGAGLLPRMSARGDDDVYCFKESSRGKL